MNKLQSYNSKAIASNLNLVFKTKNIEKLNKPTYNFLMLMSGFIAHYNLYGFMDEYQNVEDLARDIYKSWDTKRPDYWVEDFFVKKYGIEYCQSKTDTIKAILEVTKNYYLPLDN